jgi:hypothetical protein
MSLVMKCECWMWSTQAARSPAASSPTEAPNRRRPSAKSTKTVRTPTRALSARPVRSSVAKLGAWPPPSQRMTSRVAAVAYIGKEP